MRRKGFSLIDVVVAMSVFSLVFLAVGRTIVTLSDASKVSLERAHVRRELALAGQTIRADFSGAGPCDAAPGRPAFLEVNDTSGLGANSIAMFSDVDGDGARDLVAYKADFSFALTETSTIGTTPVTQTRYLAAGPLLRAVQLNTSGCDDLDAATLTFDQVVLSRVDTEPTRPLFAPRSSGANEQFSGPCDIGSCSFDTIRVRFTYASSQSGPVVFDDTYDLLGAGQLL